ncbi:hypothetical protein EP51_02410 [Rhodococcus opacus]|uniref:Uncharacterized protein n=1 Tax=Rhodococcus opacus TaxID=37919 RepID=A0A076EJ74_RHOOP|nr:hypothetical protein EP51_02410 [Rhodococcus opacus]
MLTAPWPRPGAATLIHATGLSVISVPPTVQSNRFLKLPGSVPAYSGVQNSTMPASRMSCLRANTSSGSGSWSSSGLNAGSVDNPR